MTAVNEVLEIEGTCFRIIRIMKNDEFCLFPMDQDSIELKCFSAKQISDALKKGVAKYIQDPYEKLRMSKVSAKIMERAQSKYDSIQKLVSDPRLYDPVTRSSAFRDATGGEKKLLIQLKRNLLAFWKKGLSVTALIPESGRKTGNTTCGRKGKCQRTPEVEAHLEKICQKYLLKQEHVSLEKAYILSLGEWEKKYPDTPAPSRTQLRYYFERHHTRLEKAQKQNSEIRFKKDIRSLRGSTADMVEGPGGIYEIDSTLDNIYLVSEQDRNQVIGRPTIYVVSDVFSGMITGVNVTFESSNFITAADTLYSAFASKVAFCHRYGVEISSDKWPCSGLPAQVVCDNAELTGYQSDFLVRNLGITLHNTGSYRGDQKGNVERLIGLIQDQLPQCQESRSSDVKLKKAGAQDLRPKAYLTLAEYRKIVILMAIACNNRVKEPLPKGYPDRGHPSCLEMWNWGKATGRNCLTGISNIQTVRALLLPRYPASFSREGILASGAPITSLRYWNDQLESQGAFIRNSSPYRPKDVWIALDPADLSEAYLFTNPDSPGDFVACQLAPQSSQYSGKTLHEGNLLNKARKTAVKEAQETYDWERKEAFAKVSEICDQAKKLKPKDLRDAKNKIGNIVSARKEEMIREQKESRRMSDDNSSKANHNNRADANRAAPSVSPSGTSGTTTDTAAQATQNTTSNTASGETATGNITAKGSSTESGGRYPTSIWDIHD